jgi:hypothetical protein
VLATAMASGEQVHLIPSDYDVGACLIAGQDCYGWNLAELHVTLVDRFRPSTWRPAKEERVEVVCHPNAAS